MTFRRQIMPDVVRASVSNSGTSIPAFSRTHFVRWEISPQRAAMALGSSPEARSSAACPMAEHTASVSGFLWPMT
jgi:hypothetical protein